MNKLSVFMLSFNILYIVYQDLCGAFVVGVCIMLLLYYMLDIIIFNNYYLLLLLLLICLLFVVCCCGNAVDLT